MQEQENWVKAEELKISQEAERKEQERIQARIDRLAKFGYAIDITFLRGIDDEQFEKVCDSAQIEFEKDQAAKAEQARLEQEQRDQAEKDRQELKALRDKQEAADRILKERQEELDRQAKALKDQQEAADRAEELRKSQARLDLAEKRMNQLSEMGIRQTIIGHFELEKSLIIDKNEFYGYINRPQEDWDAHIESLKPKTDAAKERAEQKRAKEIEDAKQQAIAEEQERQRKAKEKEDEDARLAEIARQEQLTKDGDKAIWADFIDRLDQVSVPTMRSGQYRKIAGMAREKMEEIQKLKP